MRWIVYPEAVLEAKFVTVAMAPASRHPNVHVMKVFLANAVFVSTANVEKWSVLKTAIAKPKKCVTSRTDVSRQSKDVKTAMEMVTGLVRCVSRPIVMMAMRW